MAVQLIMLEDVANLGKIGELVSVSAGYARNYLVPRKLATTATPGAVRQLEAKKKRVQELYAANKAAAQAVATKLATVSINIPVQAAEDEKLFGSVSAHQIAEQLVLLEFAIERNQVLLAEPIKQLGVYDVEVQLHPEVKTTIKVWVVKA